MDEIMWYELKTSKILRDATSKIMRDEYPLEVCTEQFQFLKLYNLQMEDPRFQVIFAYFTHESEPLVKFVDMQKTDDIGVMMDIPSLYNFLRLPTDLESVNAGTRCSCHVNDLPVLPDLIRETKE
jgi:hypothetical protein